MNQISQPGCYARSLGNCSSKLSREHYISAVVLKLLGEEHTISQASWLRPGEKSKPLPLNALSAKILCEYHNSMLSDLDTAAEGFFREIRRALLEEADRGSNRRLAIDGDKIERWVLKACCGALASGILIQNGRQITSEPPQKWLDILFTGADWESGTGLHIRQSSFTPHQTLSVGPIYSNNVCVGGGLEFAGLEFFVLFDPGIEKQILESSTNQFSHLIYRPGEIKIESRMQTMEFQISWRTWIPTKGFLISNN